MTEVTEIDGVGPSYAEDLQDAGYESAEDVADADPAEIDELIDRADGEELVATAEALVLSEDVSEEVEADTDESETTEVESEDEDDTDTITLEPGFSDDQTNHLLRALVREEVRNRRTNDLDAVDEIRDAIDAVKAGEPYELTLRQCDHAYTGINQLEQEYRSDRNIDSFVGEVREVTQVFQQARQDNFPDE